MMFKNSCNRYFNMFSLVLLSMLFLRFMSLQNIFRFLLVQRYDLIGS